MKRTDALAFEGKRVNWTWSGRVGAGFVVQVDTFTVRLAILGRGQEPGGWREQRDFSLDEIELSKSNDLALWTYDSRNNS